MDQQSGSTQIIELMASIVSAYVENNVLHRSELPTLMANVHKALAGTSSLPSAEPAAPDRRKLTAQEIKRSITPTHLISFEDGNRYKTLKRHLALRGLTPDAYREKWGLPVDYPVTAPSYSQQRAELARSVGLGQRRGGGLVKVSAEKALKVEAFEKVAENAEGEAGRDDTTLLEVAAATEVIEPGAKPQRAPSRRVRRSNVEPVIA